jgi:hypothetical protein
MVTNLTIVVAAWAALAAFCWVSYLIFMAWFVKHTGDPGSLRHAARAVRAFPVRMPFERAYDRVQHVPRRHRAVCRIRDGSRLKQASQRSP